MIERKSFVVLDLLCGKGNVLDGLAARKDLKGKKLKYHGVDSDEGVYARNADARQTRFEKHAQLGDLNFHKQKLHLEHPELFNTQLERVLENEKADEIYVNLLEVKNSEEILAKVLNHLKTRGTLYVLTDGIGNSNVLATNLTRLRGPSVEVKQAQEWHTLNKEKLKLLASKGLKVVKYAIRIDSNHWYQGENKPQIPTSEVAKYTDYPNAANHAVILRKVA